MKRFLFFFLSVFILATSLSLKAQPTQPENFYTNGNQIFDLCGQVFIPRGVNYALLDDWDFPGNLNNGELSSEIIKANPNTVRIQWYVNYGQPSRPAYTLSDLDSVISRFERAGIVSILEMHDVTCTDNYSGFQGIINYWTSPEMASLIQKHQKFMMLNVANEYKQVEWTNNPNPAFMEYENDYTMAIHSIRNAGIKVPIIIDAPDCGISYNRLLDSASDFYSEDSLHNIILSAHAYYYNFSSAQMQNLVNMAANASVPFIFGEIANIQDANGPCSDNITNYPSLLTACQNNNIGWLAWVWTDDICADRRVSSNGMFDSLTTYGNDIINNAAYGLVDHAAKACFEKNSGISGQFGKEQKLIKIYPNPANDIICIRIPGNTLPRNPNVTFWNVTGQLLNAQKVSGNIGRDLQFDIHTWPTGIYRLRYEDDEGICQKIFIKN